MAEKFIIGNDPGDECDNRQTQLKILMEHEEFRERLELSFQILQQADRLPQALVEEHTHFLSYWGMLPKKEEPIKKD